MTSRFSTNFSPFVVAAFLVTASFALLALYVVILGRARLQRPDLDRWLQGEEAAWDSPPLLAGIRGEGERVPGRAPSLQR